jgi:astacin
LFHEHTRSDRDTYVILYPENMNSGAAVDFARIDSTALDYGPYDYGSIMHYGTLNHSKNGEPTMEVRIPPGTLSTVIGQLDSLSPGDIAALQYMYPVEECLTNPNNPYIVLSQTLTTSPTSPDRL